jgi:hypothetical protein
VRLARLAPDRAEHCHIGDSEGREQNRHIKEYAAAIDARAHVAAAVGAHLQ